MFADLRSLIGRVALTLGCIGTLAATSVQAQDIPPDAGAPDAAAPDAAPVLEAPPTEVAPTEAAPVVEVPAVDAPVVDAPLPEAPTTNLEPGADLQTGIRGRIVDAKTGLGLEMAPVLIVDRDRTRSAITITNGAYELNVPPGVYTVRSFYDMHHGARLPNVRVTRGRFAEVNLLLDPVDEEEDVAVEEVEIAYRADTTTAAAQDAMRMEASGIGEGMGSQQMSQSGASDAGSAARRVVGVTVDGSSLVIRGLSGRYVRVYMNGAPVPSTDPDVPSVDLDLFPTAVIDNIVVNKTFLPEMPADFAGGVLDITTVTFPRELTFKLGINEEYSSAATGRNILSANGGSYDFLGFDDGTRALPSAVANRRYDAEGDTDNSVGRSFRSSWQYRRRAALPNIQANATVGNSIDLGRGVRFGYLFAAQYNHKDRRTTGANRRTDTNTPPNALTEYTNAELGSEDVQWAGISTASLDIGADHSLTLLSMFNRSTTDATTWRYGKDPELSLTDTQQFQMQYIARQLWFNQLLGDHRNLGGTRLRLRWNGYIAPTARDEPDRRNVSTYPLEEGSVPTVRGTRVYTDLRGLDGGGSASLRIPLWTDGWGTLGGGARVASRGFETRRFRVEPTVSLPAELTNGHFDDLFGPDGIGVYSGSVETTSRVNDRFDAQQNVYIAFAQVETPLVGPLSLAGGVRTEIYKQQLTTGSPIPDETVANPTPPASRTDVNVLPAVSLKYDLGHNMLLRAAYGMTVARPQARELANFLFYDYVRDRLVVGDPTLKTTNIQNVDVRWEWFFDEAQILAATVFFKEFTNPIEQIIQAGGTSVAFKNTPSARNLGAEFEFRVSLKHLAEGLRNFEFGSNLTLVYSRVQIPESLSEGTLPGPRQMFGQAPYVINLSLRFADPATNTSLGLVYNLVGTKLADVGSRAGEQVQQNVEDLPVHSLDMIGTWKMTDHLTLKTRWRNMLFQSRRLSQGGIEVLRTNPGTFVMLGLDYAY